MTRGVAFAIALFVPVAAGAAPGASLAIEKADERYTGDAIDVTLTVPAEEDARVSVAPFELEGLATREIAGSRFDPDSGTHSIRMELVALEPGARSIGPFRVEIHRNGDAESVEISPRFVDVRSLLMEATDLDPKPPSAPLPVLVPDDRAISLVYLGLAALVFGALGALLWRAIRRRRARLRPPPPPRPAWAIALEALERLREERDRGLDEAGIEAWADAVSDVIRRYLGARYGFDGLESTTGELVASLRAREPSEHRLAVVGEFLSECDLVKFAKARLALGELDRLLDAATRIVEETRSVPVASGEGGDR